jgi:HEPN domain-containing protein
VNRDYSAEGGRWVAQAQDDLAAAELLAQHGRSAQACFLAQQVAEKALKGLLYYAGADVVLGHSVAQLCEHAAKVAPELGPRCPDWATLDQHYIPTRYPDALPGGIPAAAYTSAQATSAIALARDVVAAVQLRQRESR